MIILAPVGRGSAAIVSGMPMWGNPIPEEYIVDAKPRKTDETDDIRPGLGLSGVANLAEVCAERRSLHHRRRCTTDLAVSNGFNSGCLGRAKHTLQVSRGGDILRIKIRLDSGQSDSLRSYGDSLAMYCS